MLSLPELVQIHFCMQPTDMRKGFDSLAALIRDHLECDPLSGHLFVFRMVAAGTGPTPRLLRPSIRWTETANGVKSGQTPATPRLKAAQNAGHTLVGAVVGGRRPNLYNEPLSIPREWPS